MLAWWVNLEGFQWQYFKSFTCLFLVKSIYDSFLRIWFNCFDAAESLCRGSLLLTSNIPGVLDIHLLNFWGTKPLRVNHGATLWCWIWNPWTGNLGYCSWLEILVSLHWEVCLTFHSCFYSWIIRLLRWIIELVNTSNIFRASQY